MIVRAIDVAHDWTFGNGKSNYKRNLSAVVQNINTRLYSFLGDCFFETTAGIDWFSRLGSKDNLLLQLDIAATILKTRNVTGLVQLSVVTTVERRLSISYQVQTTLGQAANTYIYDINGLG